MTEFIMRQAVLKALSSEWKSAIAICDEVVEMLNYVPPMATILFHLEYFEDNGLLESTDNGREKMADGHPCFDYRLSDRGTKVKRSHEQAEEYIHRPKFPEAG